MTSMNLRRRITITSTLAALAIAFTVAPASAQGTYKGSFELPAAAYWGSNLLQPGQYEIVTAVGPKTVWALHLKGEALSATLLNGPQPAHQSARSYLRVEEINGSYYIRELSAGPIGKSFQFGPAKASKERTEARTFMLRVSSGDGF